MTYGKVGKLVTWHNSTTAKNLFSVIYINAIFNLARVDGWFKPFFAKCINVMFARLDFSIFHLKKYLYHKTIPNYTAILIKYMHSFQNKNLTLIGCFYWSRIQNCQCHLFLKISSRYLLRMLPHRDVCGWLPKAIILLSKISMKCVCIGKQNFATHSRQISISSQS